MEKIEWIIWGVSILWFIIAVALFIKANGAKSRLRRHQAALYSAYTGEYDPHSTPLEYLQSRGFENISSQTLQELAAGWRASAHTDRQLIYNTIEMMPQLGLLGTVISIFLSAFMGSFSLQMLGLALITTIIGLVGALASRWLIELPSDKYFFSLLELLNDESSLQKLLQKIKNKGDKKTE